MRALILIHRYLGIAIGLVMAMWCVSGFVMMYMGFPALDGDRRMAALEPILWQGCCEYDKVAKQFGVDVADSFSVEMTAGRPILRVSISGGRRFLVDLRSGERVESFDKSAALDAASRFARASDSGATPLYVGELERDQWTVQGPRRDRPLHHVSLQDAFGTEIYVSSKTGQIVQHTTTNQRFWNWLGAVPHWLYPTLLRENGPLWSQVVIWLSLAGSFLTLVGLYIGIAHSLALKGGRWSIFRGVNLWHHVGGLFFGVLALTWVASGLVSMNPWGLLEGSGAGNERAAVRDAWIDGLQITVALRALQATEATDVTRIASAPLHGDLFLLVNRGSQTTRLNGQSATRAPLELAEIDRIARLLAKEGKAQVDFLVEGDHYYYSGHDPVDLPVYRITLDDQDTTRYYLNPVTGDLVGKVGSNERWYRWLFEGFHRLDFVPAMRARPWWDLLVLMLMIGVTTVCLTGVYLGYKRITST